MPGLTVKTFKNYLLKSEATSLGRLDQSHKHKRSTTQKTAPKQEVPKSTNMEEIKAEEKTQPGFFPVEK